MSLISPCNMGTSIPPHSKLSSLPLRTSHFCTDRLKVTGLAQFVDEHPSLNSRPATHNQPSFYYCYTGQVKEKAIEKKEITTQNSKVEIDEAKSSLGQCHHPHFRAIVPPD